MPKRFPVRELLERLEDTYGRARQIIRFEPMEELVSCILSQHTTDAKSFPTFTRLREFYATWDDVAKAPQEELAKVIWGAGLGNQKSKSIQRCLREIFERNNDYTIENLRAMPALEARNWLMSLPGVGPKTSSLVLNLSFGKGTIAVDTHVYRVTWRIGLIDEKLGETKAHDALLTLVPEDLAFRYHTDLIQHGRITCKAPTPLCERCPVTDYCRWYKKNVRPKGAQLA